MTAFTSRLLDPERIGQRGQVSWQALSLVRFRCYEEGLELVVEYDGLWATLRQGERPGAKVVEEIGDEMEGALTGTPGVCSDTNPHVSTGIREAGKMGKRRPTQ